MNMAQAPSFKCDCKLDGCAVVPLPLCRVHMEAVTSAAAEETLSAPKLGLLYILYGKLVSYIEQSTPSCSIFFIEVCTACTLCHTSHVTRHKSHVTNVVIPFCIAV